MTLRRILSAIFVPLFLFMAVVFPMEKSYATGSLDLVPDPSILEEKVGKQTVSGPCAAYCLAYAKTLITPNTPHQYTEYYINRECKWYKGNYTNYDPEYRYLAYNQQNKLKVLKKAYEELSAGRLPIVYVTLYYKNSGERYPHWALVVGYKNVNPNDLNSLTEGNFIVIEPNEPTVKKTLGETRPRKGSVVLGTENAYWDKEKTEKCAEQVSIAFSTDPNAKVPDPHKHSYTGAGWSKDDTNHWHECTDPNCTNKPGSIKDAAAHTFGKWSVIKEASSTNPGSKKRSCSVCGYEYTAEIPVITYTHTNAKVKMKYAVNIKKTPYASGESVHKCSVGDTFYIGAYLSNKYGNIWYQILSGPYAGYYIFSGETEFVEYVDDLSITGNTFPSNIAQGVDYKPSEVIKSRHRITSVFGAIGLKDGGKTKNVYSASVKPEVHDSYSIVGSPISDALKFDQLTPGNYNYAILVSAIADFYTQEKGADIGEGITRLTSESFWKDYQREFTVYHEHNYGGWVHDSVNHWQECTDANCTDKVGSIKDTAAHVYDNDADTDCNVCGYVRSITPPAHEHTYGDWSKDGTNHWHECTDANCTDKVGSIKDTAAHVYDDDADTDCNVCGYVRSITPPAHEHTYGDWSKDGTNHWHECTDANCTDKVGSIKDTAAHVYDNDADTDCNVCGYVRSITPPAHEHTYGDWSKDGTSHWHECTCGDKADMAAHSFRWIIDRAATATQKGSKHEECTVCGYRRAAVEIPATGTTTGGTTGTPGGGHGHYHPTTTPVPVIVIPPKTGDMTVWQSILHFLGIR